ncbi:MAG: hypothetical protein JW990_11385, partial [Thermoleophilia bacterium]|nr:hypothetical protein [Thermoleophilia bacterium]
MRILVLALIVLGTLASAASGVPQTMSYQGILRDSGGNVVPDGTYSLTFGIYNVGTGGTALWQETHNVALADGMINVVLGTTNPLDLPFEVQYWLGIAVAGESELTPRVTLTAAPYALRAATADSLAGGVSGDSDWVMSGDDIYRLDGNVGIGTSVLWKKLQISDSVDGDVSYAIKLENPSSSAGTATGMLFKVGSSNEDRGKGAIVYQQSNTWNRGKILFLQNSVANASEVSLSDVAMTIDNNKNVGIGTTTPGAKLEVTSHIRVTGFSWPATGRGLELAYNDDQNKGYVFAYDRDLGEYGNLALGGGNVGIGTNYPSERLHVNGVIYSASGGFKFPDGTVQTTANGGSGGGLVLPYAGTAATNEAALSATNTDAYGEGVQGLHSPTGNYGYLGTSYTGVLGYHGPSDCYGYVGADGAGVQGFGYAGGTGVYGSAYTGYGVHGYANGESTSGVFGEVNKVSSAAVLGSNTAASTTGKLGTDLAGAYGSGSA